MANPSEVRLTSGGAKERDEGLDLVGKENHGLFPWDNLGNSIGKMLRKQPGGDELLGLKQMESMGKMMKIHRKTMGKWGTYPFANIEYFWIFQENMERMFGTWKANDGRTQLARCMEKCMERPIKHIDNGNDLDKLIGHIHIYENNTEST